MAFASQLILSWSGSPCAGVVACASSRQAIIARLTARRAECCTAFPLNVARRTSLLGSAALLAWNLLSPTLAPGLAYADAQIITPSIQPQLAPDQSLYDATDPRLRQAGALVQEALSASTVGEEERLWTKIIDDFSADINAPWGKDVLGRAYGNRGNARSRQGKLEQALSDYARAIQLCPWSVDPVLNRGVALEALGRFEEAIADYRAVLAVAPEDPAANNNLGNALAGTGQWAEAAEYYGRAARLAPQFAFAAANRAVALYQLGKDDNGAIKEMRALLRRYPDFSDMRAALAAALWGAGLQAAAEEEWGRVDDPRYRELVWLKEKRRWPPRLIGNLTAFLGIQDVKQ